MSIVYRPSAVAELTDIPTEIAQHDPRASARVGQKVRDTADLLEANPLMGAVYRSRNPALAGIRTKTVIRYRQFVIIYRPVRTASKSCTSSSAAAASPPFSGRTTIRPPGYRRSPA